MPLFMSKDDVQRAIDDETEASTVSLEAIAHADDDDFDPESEADDFKRQVRRVLACKRRTPRTLTIDWRAGQCCV